MAAGDPRGRDNLQSNLCATLTTAITRLEDKITLPSKPGAQDMLADGIMALLIKVLENPDAACTSNSDNAFVAHFNLSAARPVSL